MTTAAAQDVLLWRPDGGRVFRLEGTFPRLRAVALAASFDTALSFRSGVRG